MNEMLFFLNKHIEITKQFFGFQINTILREQ